MTAPWFTFSVRLSGYFTVLAAMYTLITIIFGPMSMSFTGFLMIATIVIGGLALMRFAPAITSFAYGDES